MRNVYDMDSGLFYCALTSQPKEKPAKHHHHSSLAEGVAIIVSFFGGIALMFAVA